MQSLMWLLHLPVNQEDGGLIVAWTISFSPLCLCLSEETVNAVGHFYLVSVPGEVNDPTRGNGKNSDGLTNSREGHS